MYRIRYDMMIGTAEHRCPDAVSAIAYVADLRAAGAMIVDIHDSRGRPLTLEVLIELEQAERAAAGLRRPRQRNRR